MLPYYFDVLNFKSISMLADFTGNLTHTHTHCSERIKASTEKITIAAGPKARSIQVGGLPHHRKDAASYRKEDTTEDGGELTS